MTAWSGALVAVAILAAGVSSAGEPHEAPSPATAQAPATDLAAPPLATQTPVEMLGICTPGPGPGCFQCCYKNYKECIAGGGDIQECVDAYLQCRNDCIP